MKFFESANLRIITESTDDVALVRSKLISLLPIDWEKEKLSLDESSFTDAHEHERFIFELLLTKQRHVNVLTKTLFANLSDETTKTLLADVEKQVDLECNFFVRFDLDAFLEDTFVLTLTGRCLHLRFAVCAHPKKQDVAIRVVENFLSQ